MADFERRCCHKGCTAVLTDPDDKTWYKCHSGFMSRACPEHADIWREYDQKSKRWSEEYSVAYGVAQAAWEDAFNASFEKVNPQPTRPPGQPSV